MRRVRLIAIFGTDKVLKLVLPRPGKLSTSFIKCGVQVDISSDYRDLFRILNRHKVKYLIVGAYAVVYYTEPRFTKDLDIWVKSDTKNASKLYEALKEFGAPLKDIQPGDFTDEHIVYQIGVAPIMVDIFMGLAGLRFDLAWKNRTRAKYGDTPINILGIEELVKSKKRIGRAQDLLDLDKLISKIKNRGSGRHRRR